MRAPLRPWPPRSAVLLVLLLALGFSCVPSMAERASEYQVKAGFLCSLPRFTSWPRSAFAGTTDPLRIAVVGADPFGSILENVAIAQTFEGRRTEIYRVADLDHLPQCHVLFLVGDTELTADTARKLVLPGVITVGECDNFATGGGIVRLYVEAQKVKIEINPDAARRQGLRFDAQLLSLARLTRDANESEP